jgi:hypothetical protein
MAKRYASAAAFKTALEAHLRNRAVEQGVPFKTLQLKFVMERLLARLFHAAHPPWLLKGGFAMDLRFRPKARTTKDVDLSVAVPAVKIRDQLQVAADTDLGDYLTYRIGKLRAELTNAPKGGGRYPCDAILLGKVYAKFYLDVGIGDAVIGTPERLVGDDSLDFAGIGPATALAIPQPQQFAEKLHAYTFPWTDRPNSRTKDLVDLVLLIERSALDPGEVRSALNATFTIRGTHPMPTALPAPPATWAKDFPAMAGEAGLSTTDVSAAFAILARFWAVHAFGH